MLSGPMTNTEHPDRLVLHIAGADRTGVTARLAEIIAQEGAALINIGQSVTLTDDEFWVEMAKRRERLHLAQGQTVLGCPLCGYDKKPAGPPTVGGQQQQ